MVLPLWFLVVVTVGVGVMAISMILQLAVLLGMYKSVRTVQQRVQHLLDVHVEPILGTARSIAEQAQKQTHRVAEALDEITTTVRKQVGKFDEVLTEATDRARLAIIRVDEVMADTLIRFDQTTSYIQRNIVKPVQEIQAILHGVASGIGYIMRQRRSPEGVTQDEEMFI